MKFLSLSTPIGHVEYLTVHSADGLWVELNPSGGETGRSLRKEGDLMLGYNGPGSVERYRPTTRSAYRFRYGGVS